MPTYDANILPSTTGFDLGSTALRWDTYGQILDVAGNSTLAGTLGVTGASTLTGNVTCGGTLSVTGASTFTGAITANGGISGAVTGNITGNVTGNVTGILTSSTANPATAGQVRLAAADSIQFRNQANSGNVTALSKDSSNNVQLGSSTDSVIIPGATISLSSSTGTTITQSVLSQPITISTASGSAVSGAITIRPGTPNGISNGGSLSLIAGSSGESGGNGGNVVIQVGNGIAANGSIQLNGNVSKYNSISVTGSGLPAQYATVDLTAQAAAITTTTLYSVPAAGAGQYRIQWNAKVTTVDAVSSTLGALTIVYTDPDGVAVTLTAPAAIAAGTIATTSTGNTTGTVLNGMALLLNCKASTNITYAMAYVSNTPGSMKYNLHIKAEYLG